MKDRGDNLDFPIQQENMGFKETFNEFFKFKNVKDYYEYYIINGQNIDGSL